MHLELRYQQDGWWAAQRSARSPSLLNGVAIGSQPVRLGIGAPCGSAASRSNTSKSRVHLRLRRTPHADQCPPSASFDPGALPTWSRCEPSEPAPEEPPTLILRRQPAVVSVPAPPPLPTAVDSEAAPPTFIRRPSQELGQMGIIPARATPPCLPRCRRLTQSQTTGHRQRSACAQTKCEELKRERQQLQPAGPATRRERGAAPERTAHA